MDSPNQCEQCGQTFGQDEGGVPIERSKRNPDKCWWCDHGMTEREMQQMATYYEQSYTYHGESAYDRI